MSFKAGRFLTAALVVSLLIQMQIAVNGYASRKTKIAFTSNRDGNYEIYVMDGDGSNPRRVTVNPAEDRYPAWSPDGKKIAFVSNRNNKDHSQIWVIDADGKNPIRLTDGLASVFPDWSPDGTKIVYDTAGGITVMDADGRNSEQLTHDAGFKRMPSWSHDGTRIVYLANHRIWVMDSNGKNERRLTKINSDEYPTWSPDSESIAFHSIVRDSIWGIYVVDVASGAVDALQLDFTFFNLDPDWLYPGGLSVSPDGSQITIWGKLKNIASSLR